MIVLDTNIVLDLLVFDDPATPPLKEALDSRQLQWIATPAMREELVRVLAYPHIAARLAYYQLGVDAVLAAFDRQVQIVETAPRVSCVCKDPDDQKFIDLAVAHRALLLSKDHAVLRLKRRLLPLGVSTAPALAAATH
ncbi:putative toxin-antitoxin system toxin component, PIN family [Rhodoferax sp. BAB1]|uniref:putative toxin-antitoxin system toxin component, PIN family n=1 Tax=Rhodoferax sp. BAB1 TaxID=2741720 RepID=UPI001576B75A|nr:putative toxin-antitoxin system toxin component, PIN family [Rhodoferax sp. BAB1]QKO23633.1 putative toxin-antitoxin system toxin component, PIN family [Rhodoferax sp. BAB1]